MRWNLPDEKLFLFFPTEDTNTILMFSIGLKPGTNILEQRKWQDDLEKALLEYSLETATNLRFRL
jgi:hypothetical protein